MITYKDCPECGARKIHSTVSVCEVCETWTKAHAEGFRRGAEAMRVNVMQYLVRQQNEATVMVVDTAIKGVHKLPIPEEP